MGMILGAGMGMILWAGMRMGKHSLTPSRPVVIPNARPIPVQTSSHMASLAPPAIVMPSLRPPDATHP
ncbi:hypothetical protein TIFTF001_003427 [Ficus carica]|uniref:Uncharacterized protein n=1 Tax=Ficus carica TaxID=3494 RepID=A0AA88DAH5_FICCA|nr:hypothetical protein TIFTF001_003427 [Ficus carica]